MRARVARYAQRRVPIPESLVQLGTPNATLEKGWIINLPDPTQYPNASF